MQPRVWDVPAGLRARAPLGSTHEARPRHAPPTWVHLAQPTHLPAGPLACLSPLVLRTLPAPVPARYLHILALCSASRHSHLQQGSPDQTPPCLQRALDAAIEARVQCERQAALQCQEESDGADAARLRDAVRRSADEEGGAGEQPLSREGAEEADAESSPNGPPSGPFRARGRRGGVQALAAGLHGGHASGPLPSAAAAGVEASGGSGSGAALRPSTQRGGARPRTVGGSGGGVGAGAPAWCSTPLRSSADLGGRLGLAPVGTALPQGSTARLRFANVQQQQQPKEGGSVYRVRET